MAPASAAMHGLLFGGEFEAENEDEPNCGGYAIEALAAPEVVAVAPGGDPASGGGGALACSRHPDFRSPIAGPAAACALGGGSSALACRESSSRGGGVLWLLDLAGGGAVEVQPPGGWPGRVAPAIVAAPSLGGAGGGLGALAVGGQSDQVMSDKAWAASLAEGGGGVSWRELPPLPAAVSAGGRAHLSLAAFRGGVVAAGGVLDARRRSNEVHALNSDGIWKALPDLPSPVAYHSMASTEDGRIWSVGGHGDDCLLSGAWSLDPREGSWAAHPIVLSGARWAHGLLPAPNGFVVAGGYGAYGSRYRLRYLTTAELVDIRMPCVACVAELCQPRAKAAFVPLPI